MLVNVTKQEGHVQSLFGLGFSYGLTSHISCCQLSQDMVMQDKLTEIARKLAPKDGGHNKFMEGVSVWIDVKAPAYWWGQYDTYRCGISKQSESKMHTLMLRPIVMGDFEEAIPIDYLNHLNELRERKEFDALLNALPQGYLQRRQIITNYKAIRTMYLQRKEHRLRQWRIFCQTMEIQLTWPWILKTKQVVCCSEDEKTT